MAVRCRFLYGLSAVALAAAPALAEPVIVAAGGTRDELQTALDDLGGPGVIVVPPGDWELVGTVAITSDDVTILGSGSDRTRLFRAADDPDAALAAAPFFEADGVARLRVASLRIDGVAVAGSDAAEKGVMVLDALDFRVDHCVLTHLGHSGVIAYAESRGVVDHNRILDGYKSAIANLGYGVTVMGTGEYSGLPFGTEQATFIEDNFVRGARHASASNTGARYVFRHNHVTANENSHAVDAHGDEYNGDATAGTEWIEVYDNVIDAPVSTSAAIRIRGGRGVVWSNTVDGYTYGVSLWERTPQPTGPVNIWGNDWGPGVTAVGDIRGSASYSTEALADYVPYTYPHPLVTDLDVVAGPDMVMAADVHGVAVVYLDGSATSASPGAVTATRWIESEDQTVSTCARDTVELGVGQHVLLLEAERDDGLVDHDTVVVDVIAAAPLVSSAAWSERWTVPLVEAGVVRFTLTPSAGPQDAYVALAGPRVVGAHGDNAMLVRTSPAGVFDARNGDAYAAVTRIPYETGARYEVEITFDLAAQRYSATIDGVLLAESYAFRREESSIAQMTAWHASGSLTIENATFEGSRAQPDPACREAVASDGGVGSDGGAGPDGDGGLSGDGGPPDGSTAGTGEIGGGCGCATVGARPAPAALLGVLGLSLIGFGRRRRRAARSSGHLDPLACLRAA